jgi:drug/metabolite transporter (DMT)-like permease
MQEDRKKTFKIILAFAAVYIIWGTTYLAIRVAVETIPPFLMAGTRFLTAGLLVYFFLRLRGVQAPQRFQWRTGLIVGALMVGGGSGLLHWAEQTIPSGIAALIIATIPLWIVFLDWPFFRGGSPSRRVIVGLVLGFAGIILLVGPGQLAGTAVFSWSALLVLLLSPIFWSIGSLYSRDADMPKNSFMLSGMEMIMGGAVLLVVGLFIGEAQRLHLAAIPPLSWLAFLYLLVFGSIIGFSAYTYLLKNVSAAKASTYSYVNPVIAVYLGWLILNEPISATTIVAMGIIVVAVILITTSQATLPVSDQQNLRLPEAGETTE